MVELQEFFVEGGDPNRSHVLLHITEPSTREEQAKGIFFALCEINNGTNATIEQLQQIIDLMESSYYSIPESDKDVFELALEEANRRSHHLLRKHPDTVLHCLVGTIRDHHIAFAYHGKPLAALYYSSGETTGHIDIIGDDAPPEQQLFSSLMQGDMNPGDFFYGATPHVVQFLSTDRVEKIVFGRSTKQSVQHMEKVLTGLHNGQSYGGFLVHAFTKDGTRTVPTPTLTEEPKSKSSNEPTSETKSSTPRVTYETNYRPRQANSPTTKPIGLPGHIAHALFIGTQSMIKVVARIGLGVWHTIVGAILIMTNMGGQREIVIDNLRRSIHAKQQTIENLSLMSKIAIVAILISGLTFVGGLGYLRVKEQRTAALQAYEAQIQNIKDLKNDADAKLVYGDEKSASDLVADVEQKIALLPRSTTAEKQVVDNLTSDLTSIKQRLQKIVIINPTLVVDMNNVGGTIQTNALALLENSLIAYGTNDARSYIINLANKAVEVKDHNTIPHLTGDSTPKEKDTIIFTSNYSSIVAYDKNSHVLIPRDISFPNQNPHITDIIVYNQKLYSLDSVNGQIYKHNPTQTGYDKGAVWIKDTAGKDLTQGVSFSIDGDIYILRANGEIVKFTAGAVVPFSINNLSPALHAPTRLITTNNMTAIYIFEPSEKRLVAIDKANGNIIKQYTNPLWQSPADILIDQDKNTAYVLDSNIVYKFAL